MTRSIEPILVSLAPYTAVPSTLSLPIREPVSLASVTIIGLLFWQNVKPAAQGIVPARKVFPRRRSLTGTFAAARDLFRERKRQVRPFDGYRSFESSRSSEAHREPRPYVRRSGGRGFRRAGHADRRSWPVESSAIANRRGCQLQDDRGIRERRRRDGDADRAQAEARACGAWAEAGPTGK